MIRGWQECLLLSGGERQDVTVFELDLHACNPLPKLSIELQTAQCAPAAERMAWIADFYLNFPPEFQVGDEVLVVARRQVPTGAAEAYGVRPRIPRSGELLLSADSLERAAIETLSAEAELISDHGRLVALRPERAFQGIVAGDIIDKVVAGQRLYHRARKQCLSTSRIAPVSLGRTTWRAAGPAPRRRDRGSAAW